MGETVNWSTLILVPALVMYLLYLFIHRRLGGYTGDCCGALFLIIELSAYLALASMLGA